MSLSVSKGFREFDLKQLEKFQAELRQQFSDRDSGVTSTKSCSLTNESETQSYSRLEEVVKSVKSSLQRLSSDFSWDRPDLTSPMKNSTRSHRGVERDVRQNFVFVTAGHETGGIVSERGEGGSFAGEGSKGRELVLVPPHVCREFVDVLKLRVFWVDCSLKKAVN